MVRYIGKARGIANDSKPGIYTISQQFNYASMGNWPNSSLEQYLSRYSVPGLAGKFFNGNWRTSIPGIQDGNIGGNTGIPLTTANNSSNVSGTSGLPTPDHRYGVNLWYYIDYGNGIGDNYGFIAIGYFKPPVSGTYTFYTASDDGSGVWVGDLAEQPAPSNRSTSNAVLNNNMGGGQGVTKRSGSISLTKDVYYAIRIVMEEVGGGDALRFTWSGPGISEREDLLEHFCSPTNDDGSLLGDFLTQRYRIHPQDV